MVIKTSVSQEKSSKVLYDFHERVDELNEDVTFTMSCSTNIGLKTYSISCVLLGCLILMQQIGSVIMFTICFVYVQQNSMTWVQLCFLCSILSAAGWSLHLLLARNGNFCWRATLKTLAVYLAYGYAMSPIFKTLTETISTDTIYATATLMFLGHLLFHDYGLDVFIVSRAVSLNAGIFSAVCLTSRLSDHNETFAVLTWAVVLLALWPILRSELWKISTTCRVLIASATFLSVTFGLLPLSFSYWLCYLLLHLFVALCALLFVRLQSIKNTIHGPWDEAVIKD